MAHDLYIENGAAHMMYVGELPWHGLGTRLANPATSAEAIHAAGLDWKVRKVPLLASEGKTVVPARRHFGVVPEDRWGKPGCPVFGVVSASYRPLQNAEAFEFFDSVVGERVAMYHTAGALGKGERVWILAKLPDYLEITPSDMLEKYVLLSTGHDGRTGIRIVLTPVRVVCQNTLSLALGSGNEIACAYHTRDMKRQLDSARLKIQALMKGFGNMEADFRAMSRLELKPDMAKDYVNRVFPMRETDADADCGGFVRPGPSPSTWALAARRKSLRLFHEGMGNEDANVRGTLWAAYNGVTEYVDHWRAAGRNGRMSTLCFGNGYHIKTRAYNEARRMLTPASMN